MYLFQSFKRSLETEFSLQTLDLGWFPGYPSEIPMTPTGFFPLEMTVQNITFNVKAGGKYEHELMYFMNMNPSKLRKSLNIIDLQVLMNSISSTNICLLPFFCLPLTNLCIVSNFS